MAKTSILTVAITPEVHAKLRELSKQQELSMAETVATCIELVYEKLVIHVQQEEVHVSPVPDAQEPIHVSENTGNTIHVSPAKEVHVLSKWARPGTHVNQDKLTPPDKCPVCGDKLEFVDDERVGKGFCCQKDEYFTRPRREDYQ